MRRAISFKSIAPYALLAPGLIWLAIFFIYPAIQMFLVSLVDRQRPGRVPADVELGDLPRGVPGVLAVDRPLDRVRRPRHDPRLRARLPARLRDRLPRGRLQEPPAVPRHRPVLHELPAADPVLEDHLLGRRDLPRSAQDHRDHPGRFPAAGHAGSRHRRHHLQLPAVHDPAPLRRAREDRSAPARGGRGPLRRTVAAARDVRRGHPRRAARRRGRRGHGLRPDRRWASRASSRVR